MSNTAHPLLKTLNRFQILSVSTVLAIFVTGCATLNSGSKSEAMIAHENGKKAFDAAYYQKATEHFQSVIQNYPNNPMAQVAYYDLARSYAKGGNKAMAISTYQQLITTYKTGFWVDKARENMLSLQTIRQ